MVLVAFPITACGDTFGQSRLRLHATADASLLWERSFDVERVYAPSTTADGALLVLGADDCWGRDFVSEYDAATGAKRRDLPAAPIEPFTSYDPPATCPLLRERVNLSTGEQIDICEQPSDGGRELTFRDVATGASRGTFPASELAILRAAGDYLFVHRELAGSIDVVDLRRGEVSWRWQSDEDFSVLGAAGELAFVWDYERDLHALSLSDGSPVWSQRLRCNWISVAGDVLACDQILSESSCRDTDRLRYLGPSRP